MIPFTKPTLDEATISAVGDVLRSGWITSGPKVLELENELSKMFGNRPVKCFANGTATMEIGLRIAGVGPGDEVITTPISWVSTSNVILAVGAKPVFVDIDPVTHNIDLNLVEKAITPQTKAIMPVYLAGLPVNLDELYSLAKKFNLRVVEDAAQAMGSRWKNELIGSSFGHRSDLVSFSFQANKNMTSIEGGCLVMNTPEEATLAQKLRIQGVTRSGLDGMEVDVLGGKHNLTDVNAVIGIHQLKQLAEFQIKRIALAHEYFSQLRNTRLIEWGLELPPHNFSDTNWHMFQVVLPLASLKITRSNIMQDLKDLGIGTGVHYPIISDFKLYRDLGYQSDETPIAQRIGKSILTLPLFPTLTFNEVSLIVKSLESSFKKYL
ncbi:MAG: DegT/DnrJ/EryC1/StrS aminotransferase family protein [Betaproteobacteria bacterium]